MNIRTLISPIALAAALSVSGGALAQTMVGGWTVSEEDLPKVQTHCTSLASQATESLASEGETDDDDDNDGEPGEGEAETDPDPAADDGDASDLDNALTDADLDTITLEQCREAGLAEEGRIVAE